MPVLPFPWLQTVWDISRDDRARIAACSLRTVTDIFKENYSIDSLLLVMSHRVDVLVQLRDIETSSFQLLQNTISISITISNEHVSLTDLM